MDESTAMKQRPLNMAETSVKLIEKPHMIICGKHDVLPLVRKFRKLGYSFKRVKKGHWLILSAYWETNDKQESHEQRVLDISLFCEKGQIYVMELAKLQWSISPLFKPRSESEIIQSLRHYGK